MFLIGQAQSKKGLLSRVTGAYKEPTGLELAQFP